MSARTSVELDAILDEVGHYGRYQKQLCSAVLAAVVFSAMYNAQYVFNAADVDYRCLVPECESASSAQWQAGAWAPWALVGDSRCVRRAPRSADAPCEAASFGSETQRCTAWVYQTHNSIVAEFNLACQEWKRTLVGSAHSLGVFTALLYIGTLSDRLGRRRAFIYAATSCAVVGLTRSFANSYYVYIALDYLDSTVGAGVYTTGFVLVIEMTGSEKRVLFGGIIASTFAVGQVLLAVLAWAFPYWRTLTRILYTPSLCFIFYCFFLEDSFRWLVTSRHKKEAIRVLKKVAAVNKRPLSEATVKKLIDMGQTEEPKTRGVVKSLSVMCQIVRSRILMTRLAICCFCWVASTFVYYGLSINSVFLSGNMYVNYSLMSLVEIPGYMLSIFGLNRIGRKITLALSYGLCAAALIPLPLVSKMKSAASATQLVLAMLGKLAVSSAFSAIYVYTSELFPTPARHRALAACSLVGRLGQISSMFTPLLLSVMPWLPFVLFGGMAALAASLLALTPETRHRPLPDTVRQAVQLNVKPPSPHAPPAPSPATPATPAEPHATATC